MSVVEGTIACLLAALTEPLAETRRDRMLTRHNTKRKLLLIAGDCVAGLLAVTAAGGLRLGVREVGGVGVPGAPIMLGVFVACFYVSDLYNLRALGNRFVGASYLSRYILGTGLAVMGVVVLSYLWPQAAMGRGVLVASSLLMAGFGLAWRMVFRRVFILGRRKAIVAVVGRKDEIRVVERELGPDDFVVLGFNGGQEPLNGNGHVNGHVTGMDRAVLMHLAQQREVDFVVMGSVGDGRAALVKSLIHAKMQGVEVHTPASIVERVRWKVPITGLTEDWMALTPFHGLGRGVYASRLARVADVGIALFGSLMGLPLVALAAIAIKCESRGPVFYRQTRVGLNGREFKIIKLRSMRCDAERSGAVWAMDGDPRATRVGRLLRKVRLDELPQMWNVLVGDMRLIGPRPERPEFVRKLEGEVPFYAMRHAVRPGITGWAQVSFRYGASNDDAREKLEYDLFYIKNQSMFLNLVIVLKTIRVLIFGAGGKDVVPRVRRDWTRPLLKRRVVLAKQRTARESWGHAGRRHEAQKPSIATVNPVFDAASSSGREPSDRSS